jgi:AraC family transcriptional regulator, dual regulator of chb operon
LKGTGRMETFRFLEKDIIDSDMGIHYNFITQMKTLTGAHNHDFFELFLIVYGSVIHCVNQSSSCLNEGSLVFIRPEDIHYYKVDKDCNCGVINLAFPIGTLNALFDYLGRGFAPERLTEARLPPMVVLPSTEKEIVKTRLESLNLLSRDNKQKIKTESRILLLEFFAKYFSQKQEQKIKSVPRWLEQLVVEMRKKENFTPGISALFSLTNKSAEHVCRVFKEYFHQTPSQYINEIRLNYAANLLTYSDETIIGICLESGFENLSHFYHQFKRKFNMSPARFRKTYQRSAIDN